MRVYVIVNTVAFILSNLLSAWIYYVLSESKPSNRTFFIAGAVACSFIALLISSNAVAPQGSSFARSADNLLFNSPGLIFWMVAIYGLNIPASWLAIRRDKLLFQGILVLILLVVGLLTLLFLLIVYLIFSGLT